MFFEDPLRPNSFDAMALVAEHIDIPIATGERFTSLYQFQTLLTRDAVQYLRPDVPVRRHHRREENRGHRRGARCLDRATQSVVADQHRRMPADRCLHPEFCDPGISVTHARDRRRKGTPGCRPGDGAVGAGGGVHCHSRRAGDWAGACPRYRAAFPREEAADPHAAARWMGRWWICSSSGSLVAATAHGSSASRVGGGARTPPRPGHERRANDGETISGRSVSTLTPHRCAACPACASSETPRAPPHRRRAGRPAACATATRAAGFRPRRHARTRFRRCRRCGDRYQQFLGFEVGHGHLRHEGNHHEASRFERAPRRRRQVDPVGTDRQDIADVQFEREQIAFPANRRQQAVAVIYRAVRAVMLHLQLVLGGAARSRTTRAASGLVGSTGMCRPTC